MQEYQKAVKAVAEPSRAQELKEEAQQADLEDLLTAYRRAHNNGQRRRLRKEMKKRFGVIPAES